MTEPDAVRSRGLPPVIELLWGNAERASRPGPKPGLTLDEIVAAAVAIADEDGLAALSMARLAKAVGKTTMSLYRYVRTKDDLLALMRDAASGLPPPEVVALVEVDGDWRAGLRRWAKANLELTVAHPWTLEIPYTGVPLAPNQVAWMEAGLQVLSHTPLEPGEQVGSLLVLSSWVLGQARLVAEINRSQEIAPAPESAELYAVLLSQLADPDRFPALSQVVMSGVFAGVSAEIEDADHDFGLDTILDGIAARIARRAAGDDAAR